MALIFIIVLCLISCLVMNATNVHLSLSWKYLIANSDILVIEAIVILAVWVCVVGLLNMILWL